MSEEKKVDRRVKVYLKQTVWVEGANAKPMKIKAGQSALMTAEEIKHFSSAVTKDIPDDVPEFERAG